MPTVTPLRLEQHLDMAKPVLTQFWLVNGNRNDN
jgi:hypothetical protein